MQQQITETPRPGTSNSIYVIAPYWSSGTWVFDDPARGLLREPFVSGVPDVLSDLVTGIPDAHSGFRLIFSAQKFPGSQARFEKVRTESGGTWYEAEDGREGWLCPALFKYFTSAPRQLFVRVEPMS